MPNMSENKQPMPHQPADVRNKNWKEVATGYTAEMAREEADRCLNCRNKPCVEGCPVGVDIPGFITKLKENKLEESYALIKETNSLPAICGRVCPQETQCEAKCVRGIKGEPVGIGRLERYVADNATGELENLVCEVKTGHKVAVIGSGPAGLTCAGTLAKLGHDVTVFEAFHTAGGVLVYGIPEFRLPKAIVAKEVGTLMACGVDIDCNSVIGRVKTIDELFEDGYEAIFISTGAGLPNFMNIEGEESVGVYSANEFLTRINLMKAYDEDYVTPINIGDTVVVVGGGNVAMDAARCAKRLGAKDVFIVYRRSDEEMPARREEIDHAKEEGIIFKTLNNPTKILADDNGFVVGMECVCMELGEPDDSGRRSPRVIEGSEYTMPVDTVVMAIGTSPNPLIASTTEGLETNRRGCVVADDNMRTSIEGVWAGGDVVTGAATVILAMGAGRTAAADIDEYLKTK